MARELLDLKGMRFGRLLVLEVLPKSRMKVLCDCGTIKEVRKGHLIDGNTSSCGCLRTELLSEKAKIHGMEGSSTYRTWNSMMTRCYNKNNINYQGYGGSGVTVCDEWHKFENFYKDMGVRPDGMSLNRKNGVKIYSKENCEWATYSEQSFDQKKRVTNTSGRTGVSFQKKTSKWKVEISKERKVYFIGYFTDFNEAVKAREEAELKYYGRILDQ